MSGVVVIPWYATGFRGDQLEIDLKEIAAISTRYGASDYRVYRGRDDRYRFQQMTTWDEHIDWQRYWESPEMTYFRATHSGWYQVPLLYTWWDLSTSGSVDETAAEPAAVVAENGDAA
jgi:hypothetical protein